MSGVGSGATCSGCERWDYDINDGEFCAWCRSSRVLWAERLGANFIAAGLAAELVEQNSTPPEIYRSVMRRYLGIPKAGAP